jgi:hypothetical protein
MARVGRFRDKILAVAARTLQEMPPLERRPGWRELKAVQQGRIFVADGNQYFNRPGPRIVESLKILGKIFHPSCSLPGMKGEARCVTQLGRETYRAADPDPPEE